MPTKEQIVERVKYIIERCTLGYSSDNISPEQSLKDMNFVWESYSIPGQLQTLFLEEDYFGDVGDNEEILNNNFLLTDNEVEEFLHGADEIKTVGDFINKAISLYQRLIARSKLVPGYKPIDLNLEAKKCYRIINKRSRLSLNITGFSVKDGEAVEQYYFKKDNNGDSQIWLIIPLGKDEYVIVNKRSNLVLGIYNYSIDSGKVAQQLKIAPNQEDRSSQTWIIKPTDDGYYTIVNKKSHLYLSIDNFSPRPSASVRQYELKTDENQNAQLWQLEVEEEYDPAYWKSRFQNLHFAWTSLIKSKNLNFTATAQSDWQDTGFRPGAWSASLRRCKIPSFHIFPESQFFIKPIKSDESLSGLFGKFGKNGQEFELAGDLAIGKCSQVLLVDSLYLRNQNNRNIEIELSCGSPSLGKLTVNLPNLDPSIPQFNFAKSRLINGWIFRIPIPEPDKFTIADVYNKVIMETFYDDSGKNPSLSYIKEKIDADNPQTGNKDLGDYLNGLAKIPLLEGEKTLTDYGIAPGDTIFFTYSGYGSNYEGVKGLFFNKYSRQ